MPPSTDVVLREHYWFWQNGTVSKTKTTKKLVENYLTSVGRASNLILNVAPDSTGAIPTSDKERYQAMGEAIKCLFSEPIAKSDSLSMGTDGAMTFTLPAPTTSTNFSLVLREDQREGQLIGNFSLECQFNSSASAFLPCESIGLANVIPKQLGAGVGHKRIFVLGQPAGSRLFAIRLWVQSHYATGAQVPTLRDMSLYNWGGKVESCV
jgi:hypothetical protein